MAANESVSEFTEDFTEEYSEDIEECRQCRSTLDCHVLCKTCECPYCPNCYKKIQEDLDKEDPKREVRGKRKGFVCDACYDELTTDFVVPDEEEKIESDGDYKNESSSSDSSFSADTDDRDALDDAPRPKSQEEKIYEVEEWDPSTGKTAYYTLKNGVITWQDEPHKATYTGYWDQSSTSSSEEAPLSKNEVKRKLDFSQ